MSDLRRGGDRRLKALQVSSERRETDRRYLPRFRCPVCGHHGTSHVREGRMNQEDGYYWRRRRCDHCGEIFTTREVEEALNRPSPAKQELRTNKGGST